MRQRFPSVTLCVGLFVRPGSSFHLRAPPLPSAAAAAPPRAPLAPTGRAGTVTARPSPGAPCPRRHSGGAARALSLSSPVADVATVDPAAADDEWRASRASTIASHLERAAAAHDDVPTQQKEMDGAERALVQWVEAYRGRGSHAHGDASAEAPPGPLGPPGAGVFSDVIAGLLQLPVMDMERRTPPDNRAEDYDPLRRQLWKKGKAREHARQSENNKSARATLVLDLMESFHAPTGPVYDALIASHGEDVLRCLSHLARAERDGDDGNDEGDDGDDGDDGAGDATATACRQQAWRSAKSARQLLDRSEDFYRETDRAAAHLPAVASYVTVMDVWKALAVGGLEGDNDGRRKSEALEVVRNTRGRRAEVYRRRDAGATAGGPRDDQSGGTFADGISGCVILPRGVASMTLAEVLDCAAARLREEVPGYRLVVGGGAKVGTYHFNQLIFDLAAHPQPFSGALAQDLLDYMMYTVKKGSPAKRRRRRQARAAPLSPAVPKPNVATVNGVLKAWMVTPGYPDAARHAEAVLAKLAGWQSEGTLWGVSADVVSYNTCINCWKESGIPGAAQRAADILRLMEDESTAVVPDVVSYATCIGAWADRAARDPAAAKTAEEILMRMHHRNRDAAGDEAAAPAPTTRCFNAVLLAYANARQVGGGKHALELLEFMEHLRSTDEHADLSPDRYTFNIIMKALLCCGETGASKKAHQLLQRMEDSYREGDTTLKPDLLSYNTVLDSFSKEGDAKSAERLLEQMFDNGDDAVKPNAHSYTAVLTAWSRCSDKALAVRQTEALFDDIEGRYAAGLTDFRAETSVYNALINCWAKSDDRRAPRRVTQILSLMEELGLKGGDDHVQPNSRTYCAVLDALARSRNPRACGEALEILARMEGYHADGYDAVRPCARAYSIVLSALGRSRRKGKARTAQDLLHRMEAEYVAGNGACRPNVISYNAVLNAAAFCGRDEAEQEEAFKVACLTFDELRMSDYLQPTHVSYGTFLKAIKKLMPESDVRDNLVKSLFRKCCRDGLVSDFVLKEMSTLSQPGLYQSLLEGVTNEYGNLPKNWSANC